MEHTLGVGAPHPTSFQTTTTMKSVLSERANVHAKPAAAKKSRFAKKRSDSSPSCVVGVAFTCVQCFVPGRRISIFSLQREFELLRRDAKIGEEEEGEEFNPSFVFHGFSIGCVFFALRTTCQETWKRKRGGAAKYSQEEESSSGHPCISRLTERKEKKREEDEFACKRILQWQKRRKRRVF